MSTQQVPYNKTYTYDNAAPGERDRLRLLERTWDPGSTSAMARIGLAPAWKVLMVGGGGGSLVDWVARQVGPDGRVLATDLDPRFLRSLAEHHANLEVRQHNVVTEQLPETGFDLVHTRLLVAWLPEREEVVRKMAAAVRPGGWLLIEDADAGSFGPVHLTAAAEKMRIANARFLVGRGYEPFTGRLLPGMFRRLGLEEVDAVGIVHTLRGASSVMVPWYLSTFRLQRRAMVDQGLITDAEADELEQRYADPDYDGLAHTMMSVWGRRP